MFEQSCAGAACKPEDVQWCGMGGVAAAAVGGGQSQLIGMAMSEASSCSISRTVRAVASELISRCCDMLLDGDEVSISVSEAIVGN